MVKHLFSEDFETYTDEANDLDRRATALIDPLVREFVEKGYSLRDVAYILRSAVDLSVCSEVLLRNTKLHKEKRNGKS